MVPVVKKLNIFIFFYNKYAFQTKYQKLKEKKKLKTVGHFVI